MPTSRRKVRRALARVDPQKVLVDVLTDEALALPEVKPTLDRLTDEALAWQEAKPSLDRDNTKDDIKKRVTKQAIQILGDAKADYAEYEANRELAEHNLGRSDYVAWGICGILVGYIIGAALLTKPHAAHVLTGFVVAVLVGLFIIRWRTRWLNHRRLLSELDKSRKHWTDALVSGALIPFILETLDGLTEDSVLYAACLNPDVPPRLIERSEPRRLVTSEAMDRIRTIAESMREGSLGVSGPRGVGKSTIVHFFCDNAYHSTSENAHSTGDSVDTDSRAGEPELRVALSAPVDYQPRDFILHLFARLGEAFLGSDAASQPDHQRGAPLPGWLSRMSKMQALHRQQALTSSADHQVSMQDRTHRLLADLRYLRTYTAGWNASMTPVPAFGWAGSRGRQLAEQPVPLPELVARYREYSEDVAAAWRSFNNGKGRVIIGIDEVDKILDGERAETFLNDIKAIFGVPGCLYVVSVSEDALAIFARRALSIRTTFDSAFDEVVAVTPMSYQNSQQLLIKRVAGLPRPFVALCHVLAGGLPRDLVRVARGLINAARSGKETTLPELASTLVQRELDSLRRASLSHLATLPGSGALLNRLYNREWPGTEPPYLVGAAARLSAKRAEADEVSQVRRELIVSLSFYATVLTMFGSRRDTLINQLRVHQHGLVDELAEARHAMRLDVGLAQSLIDQYCLRNGIDFGGAP
jgi:hypothetical protein